GPSPVEGGGCVACVAFVSRMRGSVSRRRPRRRGRNKTCRRNGLRRPGGFVSRKWDLSHGEPPPNGRDKSRSAFALTPSPSYCYKSVSANPLRKRSAPSGGRGTEKTEIIGVRLMRRLILRVLGVVLLAGTGAVGLSFAASPNERDVKPEANVQ